MVRGISGKSSDSDRENPPETPLLEPLPFMTHVLAFPQRIARPLPTGPDPCGRIGFGPAVLGHAYIPRLQSEGPIGTRFAMASMYSLPSANTSELSSS